MGPVPSTIINAELIVQSSIPAFVSLAERISKVWEDSGVDGLTNLLINEIELSPDEARDIAEHYLWRFEEIDLPVIRSLVADLNRSTKAEFDKLSIFSQLGLTLHNFWPKNLLAWHMMRHIFGSEAFDFIISKEAKAYGNKKPNNGQNIIHFPNLLLDARAEALPFQLAALDVVKSFGSLPPHAVKKAVKAQEILGNEIGLALAKCLVDAHIIFPPMKVMEEVCRMINRGLAGETVLLTGAFCPDYTYEETGSRSIPYRYTFEGLGSGVGLVALQFVRMIPILVRFMESFQIPYKVQLYIGDFESNSADNCQRVGCDQSEFLRRCHQSLETFKTVLPGISMELGFFERDLAGDRWQIYIDQAYGQMLSGDFGGFQDRTGKNPDREIEFIAEHSRSFYENWHGRQLTEMELRGLVITQAAEYVAVTQLIEEEWSGPAIQLAGDRAKINAFNSVNSTIPTLCAKRIY